MRCILLFIFQFIEGEQIYRMTIDKGFWSDSHSDSGSGSETESYALMPYYNDDLFSDMCTAGPNGLAVYFYPVLPYLDGEGEACVSIEENKSSDERDTCLPPQDFVSSSSRRDWIVSVGISSLQYTLFGMFVLCLNRLRRYHKRRKRLSSSTTSAEEVDLEVSRVR